MSPVNSRWFAFIVIAAVVVVVVNALKNGTRPTRSRSLRQGQAAWRRRPLENSLHLVYYDDGDDDPGATTNHAEPQLGR